MKLLDWMHRKFRQNTYTDVHTHTADTDAPKNLSVGNSCACFPGFPGHSDLRRRSNMDSCKNSCGNYLRNSFADEYGNLEEDLSNFFHGFLTIGTLGAADPPTPTFSISAQHIAGEQESADQMTENELKLIDGLEKVLGADDSCNASSGRNSLESAGRVSHCSMITLSGQVDESNETLGNAICPLQGYLFGSVAAADTTRTVKERRTSLRDLLQKGKQPEGNPASKSDMAENTSEKSMKKKSIPAHPMTSAAKTKLRKILHMFNKKVHPETSCGKARMRNKNNELKKNETKHGPPRPRPSCKDDVVMYLKESCKKSHSYHSPDQIDAGNGGSASAGNNECWVKTDADYLVLEL